MRKTIRLNAKPISVNNLYYNNRSHGKKADAKAWEMQIMQQLWGDENQSALTALREAFDSAKHAFSVHMICEYPDFYNKAGDISSKVADLSNIEKALIDVVFTPQFYGTHKPAEVLNINIDDKYIRRLYSEKRHGPLHTIALHIKIIPK